MNNYIILILRAVIMANFGLQVDIKRLLKIILQKDVAALDRANDLYTKLIHNTELAYNLMKEVDLLRTENKRLKSDLLNSLKGH